VELSYDFFIGCQGKYQRRRELVYDEVLDQSSIYEASVLIINDEL